MNAELHLIGQDIDAGHEICKVNVKSRGRSLKEMHIKLFKCVLHIIIRKHKLMRGIIFQTPCSGERLLDYQGS